MTEAQIERLFQAFEQADASTTRKYGGTGLGLAISKQLTELMGGHVSVKSEPGKGSTFKFTARLGKGTATPRPRLLQSDLRGRRVLIIDDNPHARAVLANMLTNMSLVADEAASGEEALSMVREAAKSGERYEIGHRARVRANMSNTARAWGLSSMIRTRRPRSPDWSNRGHSVAVPSRRA